MLEFDAASHTYSVKGRVVPSVTQVLQAIENFDHVPFAVLEAAREFGTHVHQACDLLNRGVLDEESLDPQLVPYVNGWKRCLSETGMVVTHSEEKVYNPKMRYAGTLDSRANWKGTTWVIDLKSGAVPRSVGPQLEAYRHACSGDMPRRRLCVQLKPNDYKLIACNDLNDFSLFTSALNIWHFLHRGQSHVNDTARTANA